MTNRHPSTKYAQSKPAGQIASTYPVPSSRAALERCDLEHGLVPVADGVRLHYVVAGDGDPVLLIPGWPQSWYAWRFVIPLLVNHGRRVYAIDPRGFGDSDMPVDGYDLETVAADVHTFIERLALAGDRGIDVVSHDVGSWIAHAHVADYPHDVHRLVITDATIPGVSPPPPADYPDRPTNERSWHFGFNRIEGLPEALIHGREREFLAWFFGPAKMTRQWTIDADAFEEYLRVFSKPGAVRSGLNYYREVFSARGREASRQRRKVRLTLPVLTVGGADADGDNLFHTMSQFSDDVRNVVFEGIGHHLPEECPEDLVEVIIKFWNE
jgi:pimeloyl-ACP methyl ester carboxylesterase